MDVEDVLMFIGGVICLLITLAIIFGFVLFLLYLGNPESENAMIRIWVIEPGQEWCIGFMPAGFAAGVLMFGFTAYFLIEESWPW